MEARRAQQEGRHGGEQRRKRLRRRERRSRYELLESLCILFVSLCFYITTNAVNAEAAAAGDVVSRDWAKVLVMSVGSWTVTHAAAALYPHGPPKDQPMRACAGMGGLTAIALRSCYLSIVNMDRTQPQIVQAMVASASAMNGSAFLVVMLSAMYHTRWPEQASQTAVHVWRDTRIVLTIVGYARCCVVLLIQFYHPETTR